MKKQIISILFAVILIFALKNTCAAASASISCDSTATVDEKITINVKVNAVQWNLELKVNDETIAKNYEVDNVEGNKNITFSGTYTPKEEGTLNITLNGTATEFSDGSTIKNFEPKTITVKAKEIEKPVEPVDPKPATKSSEARLQDLGITPNDFKGFKRDTYTYDVEVPNNVSKVNVYAKTLNSNAKITSGTGNVSLKEGLNTVKVTVTAEDGVTKKTYTLNITRKLADETTGETGNESSEARLSNLGINPKDYDFSGFKKDTTSYSVKVPSDVEEIEVYAEAVSSKAKITGTGKVSLKEGKNTVTVEVTAEDGTKKTYTIEITREESSTVANETNDDETEKLGLSTLTIKNFQMNPKFDIDTYEYTIGLTEDLSSLEIEAKTSNKNTTVEIIGNENLKQGENVITILVSNAQTNEVATYQIIVNKNVQQDDSEEVNWLKPSTWGKREKIVVGAVVVLAMIIVVAIVVKVRLARQEDDDDLDLPGGDELDRALAEHQELTEDIEEEDTRVQETTEIQEDETKTDAEKAQEYFESYSKRKGKHF